MNIFVQTKNAKKLFFVVVVNSGSDTSQIIPFFEELPNAPLVIHPLFQFSLSLTPQCYNSRFIAATLSMQVRTTLTERAKNRQTDKQMKQSSMDGACPCPETSLLSVTGALHAKICHHLSIDVGFPTQNYYKIKKIVSALQNC